MARGSYQQFCPVAMASEVLCTRWTMVLVRELVAGSTRFGELRRGVPRMSPTLLSQRLKDLEAAGILVRTAVTNEPGIFEYLLTPAGQDLKQIVEAFGIWGQKWIETQATLENLDPSLLMWDMRRNINPAPLPAHRTVVQFRYPELPANRSDWWLIINPNAKVEVDLCAKDPGFTVDLWVTTDLKTMTAIWLGLSRVQDAGAKLLVDGDPALIRSLNQWLGLSRFAGEKKIAV
ncbi:winged helix-turn-helix transcriptional regulator [Rhodalgimonas zhirmunskyi]|uniref:Helix-turn-helix transcriptional regulator n=1 Tax=Rhodalgimonas zhirmunskyi TaxID=2964767 RepID=A0AAJ1UAC3_9RHOB|nr:helix-turn-helix domain-containing protein [Rhodoalgimonas zhirmunskyi]MDQ2094183.1 helix-turn-helix transcriptional regulator [Rhodoalgimonas zhirmunskyi]